MNPIETSLESTILREVEIVEHHLHNHEKWYGLAGTPDTEVHRADRLTLLPAPFQLDAGSNTWGSWLQLLGSTDTPLVAGNTYFDFHKLLIVLHERNSTMYAVQLVSGESAGIAAKLVAEDFNCVPFITPSAPGGQNQPIFFTSDRYAAGDKVWARIWARGAETGTLDFYIGLHEYAI